MTPTATPKCARTSEKGSCLHRTLEGSMFCPLHACPVCKLEKPSSAKACPVHQVTTGTSAAPPGNREIPDPVLMRPVTQAAATPGPPAATPGAPKVTPRRNSRTSPRGTHYVVIQHGMDGTASELQRLRHAVQQQLGSGTTVLVPEVSQGKTTDGVKAGGHRLAEYIKHSVPAGSMISIIGHSLGGLFCRSAVGNLNAARFFDKVTPVCFLTLSSPHLGIMDLEQTIIMGAAMTKGASGVDMALQSSAIMEMTDDVHLSGLRRFTSRVLYGAAMAPGCGSDPVVKYGTALLTVNDPATVGPLVAGTAHVRQPIDAGHIADPATFGLRLKGGDQVFQMLQRLGSLGWTRFPVTFSTQEICPHAAVISHAHLDGQGQGQDVCKHVASQLQNAFDRSKAPSDQVKQAQTRRASGSSPPAGFQQWAATPALSQFDNSLAAYGGVQFSGAALGAPQWPQPMGVAL